MREQTELEKAIISAGGNVCKICQNSNQLYVHPLDSSCQEPLHYSDYCKHCKNDYPTDRPMYRFRLAEKYRGRE